MSASSVISKWGIAFSLMLVAVLAVVLLNVGSRADETIIQSATVVRGDVASTVLAGGRIEPVRGVKISSDLSGRVVEVAVREGTSVDEGQLLLRLDPTRFRAAVRQAQAALSGAQSRVAVAEAEVERLRREVERTRVLHASGNVAQQVLDDLTTDLRIAEGRHDAARFEMEEARERVQAAREELSKTTIRAPMAGHVTQINVEVGETAVVGTMNNPGSLLLSIADLSEMQVRLLVNENDVPLLSPGDRAEVTIDAFNGPPLDGRVKRVVQQTPPERFDPSARVDFEVLLSVDAGDRSLPPGLSATAKIVSAARSDVLVAPLSALTARVPSASTDDTTLPTTTSPRREGVFVIRNGRSVFTPVDVGIIGDQMFEVQHGLQEGDDIVVGTYDAIRKLNDGDPIRQTP